MQYYNRTDISIHSTSQSNDNRYKRKFMLIIDPDLERETFKDPFTFEKQQYRLLDNMSESYSLIDYAK